MLGNREEAQDAAQEAFIRAYVNIHSYDTSKSFPPGYIELLQIFVLIEFVRKSQTII